MAITYSGSAVNQTELEEIQSELYQDSATFREAVIDIQEGHKSGTDVYESKVSVTAIAATTAGVTATGNIDLAVQKSPVNLVSFEFQDVIKETTLLQSRFERSMKAGAFEHVSDEFDRKVLIDVTPAIGEAVETMIWNGATTATKAAIAALTPGAGQGSISAGAQTLVAAMPTALVDSLPATILYNASQSKTVPGAGIGDYKKVLSIAAVTSATIAAEYGKLYAAGDQKVVNNTVNPALIFAPLGDKQLMKIANNSVGAASNQNFLFEGTGVNEKAYYNGIEVKFVPLVGFRVLTIPVYLKVLMDLKSDMSSLQIGPMANGAMERFIKNIQTMATWVTNQRYITLYGG